MIEVKNNWSTGMDLDTSYYSFPKTSYAQALNITRDGIEGSVDEIISNIPGNRLVDFDYPTDGVIINITPHPLRNTAIFFRHSPEIISAPLSALIATATQGSSEVVTYSYKVTFVNAAGDESIVSPVSNTVIIGFNNHIINLTAIPVSSDPTVTKRRIYRYEGGIYRLLITINDNTTTTYSDVTDNIFGNEPNPSGGYDAIYEYNRTTDTISKIFVCLIDSETNILNFGDGDKITSVNIYAQPEGDLLYFLDTLGRPTGLNITRFKNDEYNPVTRDIIDAAKTPAPETPDAVYANDTSRLANNLRNKFFKFAQVNVFDDNEEATFSPQSSMPIPVKILDEDYTNVITNNNVINLSLNSGPKNVKAIRLLVSYVEKTNVWSDFATVEVIDKSTISLTETSTSLASGTTTREVIVFKGYVAIGTIINIYLTLLPSTRTLVGTYTTVSGDTITNIYNGLAASITSIGIGTLPLVGGWGLYFDFNNTIYSFDETEITILNTDIDNISFPYLFYNDSTYPTYDVLRAIQLQDYVPRYAESQEMANGNTIEYAGITEGLPRDITPNVVNTVLTVAAGGGGTIGNLNGILTSTGGGIYPYGFITITFSGVPATGTVVTIKVRRLSDSAIITIATYTTLIGDTSVEVVAGLATSMATLGVPGVGGIIATGNVLNFTISLTIVDTPTFTIVAPATGATLNSIASWLWSTERRIGIQYFDQKGKTNGVLYNAKITFPAYSENGSQVPLLPYINTKIYHVPPIWAYSYTFLFTKEPTIPLFWYAIDVNIDEITFLQPDPNIYFDVSNIALNATKNPTTVNVLSYTFADGDRMRLIRRMSDGMVYNTDYDAPIIGLVTDPTIYNVVQTGKTFVKIKGTVLFNAVDYTSNNFVIEIYRPGQQAVSPTNETYYEFGEEYPILDPGTDERVHGGQVTNQSTDYITPAEFNFYSGDSYFRQRAVPISETDVETFNVQDKNVVDNYISAVSSISGRPSVIDINAKETVFPAVIRFSQAIQPNTNINGLNRFFPPNFIEADAAFGSINRMQARDRQLELFQEFKTGFSPLFSQIGKDSNGNDVIYTTDILLNPVRYYLGEFGIGSLKACLAFFNYAIYFCDPRKGAILRLSRDGITHISEKYKANSWATQELPLRTDNNVIGAFDQNINNYIIAAEATDDSLAQTLIFSEDDNTFETFISAHPEAMGTLGTLLIMAKDGDIWVHDSPTYNNFFGTQYESNVKMIFNQAALEKKTPLSITESASVVWDCSEIVTNVKTYGNTPQLTTLKKQEFQLLEGQYHSAIKRDTNSRGGKINGDTMKANYTEITFRLAAADAATLQSLNIVSLKYIDSPLTNK